MRAFIMAWPWLDAFPDITVKRVPLALSPARGDITPDPDDFEYIAYRGGATSRFHRHGAGDAMGNRSCLASGSQGGAAVLTRDEKTEIFSSIVNAECAAEADLYAFHAKRERLIYAVQHDELDQLDDDDFDSLSGMVEDWSPDSDTLIARLREEA